MFGPKEMCFGLRKLSQLSHLSQVSQPFVGGCFRDRFWWAFRLAFVLHVTPTINDHEQLIRHIQYKANSKPWFCWFVDWLWYFNDWRNAKKGPASEAAGHKTNRANKISGKTTWDKKQLATRSNRVDKIPKGNDLTCGGAWLINKPTQPLVESGNTVLCIINLSQGTTKLMWFEKQWPDKGMWVS